MNSLKDILIDYQNGDITEEEYKKYVKESEKQ